MSAPALEWPSRRLFPSYVEALREGFRRGIAPVKTPEEIAALEADPDAALVALNVPAVGSFETPSGHKFEKVPYETLWLVREDLFIGEVSFRLALNEFLLKMGGHVGYGIRPSLMNQGYGTLALKLTLERAAEKGLDKLLVSCAPDNIGSERVILKNGGVYENTQDNAAYGYGLTKRFWIPVRTL